MRTRTIEPRIWYEDVAWPQGVELLAGVDETGRGPIAGPVVAAAVILLPDCRIPDLDDSKRLTPKKRENLLKPINQLAVSIGIGTVESSEIDASNIVQATYKAMRCALLQLSPQPEFVLVDGFPIPFLELPQQAMVKGDRLSRAIAAASVVAKVSRDEMMRKLHLDFPDYGFARNKGYATPQHLQALKEHGPCPKHRFSFRPVSQFKLPFSREG